MSSSTNEKFFTPERIKKMQQYLIDHPIDHKYDELCAKISMMGMTFRHGSWLHEVIMTF